MSGDAYGSRESGRHGSSRDYHSSRDDRRDRDRDHHSHRRRSRSPNRRRRDGDLDSYSSSRDYRAREREDRYASHGGGGREDRGAWDRGGRRDQRRDDHDRRRDRDLFADRGDRAGDRGGYGRDRGDRGMQRGDRDELAQQAKRRSASPPRKRREPTPDLTDIVPVTTRKRRLTQWDIKPPGYENVTAEQAKLSGMFPLPGAPQQHAVDPTRLQALVNQPAGASGNTALKPSNARQAKRLFVSNLPASATEDALVNFFNVQLNGLNVISTADPCVSAQLAPQKEFALLEFKNASEATVALALDGASVDEDGAAAVSANGTSNGTSAAATGLQIRRPKDYIAPSSAEESEYQPGEVSPVVPDTPNKICVMHLLTSLTDEQVQELLVAFGPLKAFVLVKDSGTEESRGIAFCEYADAANTDVAVEGLNGMELGDRHLRAQRASLGAAQASGLEMGVNAMSMLAGTTSDNLEEGRVLQLLNMVTPDELMDGDEYEEICEDVQEECAKFGPVLELKVPRPSGGSRQSNGVGKIFVKFGDSDSARKALQALAGRKFADRTVVTTYFPEESFEVNAW